MKIIDFTELELEDQLQLLYHEGVYLSKRRSGPTRIILYQFKSLYVEIFYITYRAVVSHIVCSDSTAIIEPYLDQINLTQLMEL